ncbi:MAG: hypothetical protein ACAH80_00470 [Alphaproteobacteria bacterium]
MMKMEESTRKKMVKIFGRFMQAEVPMTEQQRVMKVAGEEITFHEVNFTDVNHPVLVDLRKTAKQCGLDLRIWFPGMVGTMELNTNRLNVHIDKGTDGKWRISERMNFDASPSIIRTMDEIIARGLDKELTVRKPFQFKRAPAP